MGNPNMRRNTIFHKTCISCGKEFETKASVAKYCSDCREQKERDRFKTHRNNPLMYKPKVCESCKGLFVPRGSTTRYCDTCKELQKKLNDLRKPILKCPLCNRLYIKTGNNQKRCEVCQYKQLYSNDYRTIAFENLPHRCNRCGISVNIFTSDVHHKDRDRENQSLDNLEILCKSCHHLEHLVRDAKTGKIITNK